MLAHFIEQVIQPLFARLHGPLFAQRCRHLFNALAVIVRQEPALHDSNFPADPSRWQLVCDRLDSLEVLVKHLLARKQARQHPECDCSEKFAEMHRAIDGKGAA